MYPPIVSEPRKAGERPNALRKVTSEAIPVFQELYRCMLTARKIDALEEQITQRGEAFFQVSGAGHEAVAALNPHLIAEDWLHCHYRDKALLLARGMEPEVFFDSLLCKQASHSKGRQMSAHMADRDRHILSLVGPVGNNALQAVGVAATIRDRADDPIVLCAMGDGTAQEGEVLEAIAEAVRWELPVLFLIEDNGYSISTLTPQKTFFSLPDKEADQFYGMKIHRVEGCDTVACYHLFEALVGAMRRDRKPKLALMKVDRLAHHTNADDQSVYRSQEEIEKGCKEADPILFLAHALEEAGLPQHALERIDSGVEKTVQAAAQRSLRGPDPHPVFTAKKPLPEALTNLDREYRGTADGTQLTMLEAIRAVFRERMQKDERITLYGEDIEDPKGDVFGLTRGLTEAFPDRVKNSPLAEATIVGTAIGRALAGGRPAAFLQFADFLPIAFNQILSEMGSMYWRTDGAWQCPVIVMITCGGYRPGLGPFHAQTLESVAAHTPGVDVFMPATAADAAGLLNAAFDSERPTLFFYPKSCLNDRNAMTSSDVRQQLVSIGYARLERSGHDITFVAWGNTVSRCCQAADVLEAEGITSEILDLRSLSPWDEAAVVRSVRKTGKLIVAHEDNHTCGFGAEILATVAEKVAFPVKMKRVTRPDTYVPCNFANQLEVLPSFERILTATAELLDFDLSWERPPQDEPGIVRVEAVGSSPSDESVTVSEWNVKAGESIKEGQLLATFEADKAVGELLSPVSGTVRQLFFKEGETVKVGTTLLDLAVKEEDNPPKKTVAKENPGTPILKRRPTASATSMETPRSVVSSSQSQTTAVGIVGISSTLGGQVVSNEVLAETWPDKSAADIYRSIGVRHRRRIGAGESVLSLGVKAAKALLQKVECDVADLDMIVCSTGTPELMTPSLACRILYGLGGEKVECQAHDVNAACTGYLYALQSAYDFLQSRPEATILVITSEVLSPLINANDFDTAIIFSDAATATLVCGVSEGSGCRLRMRRPDLSAQGEPGDYLTLPAHQSQGCLTMNGAKVFTAGVRKMIQMLKRSCKQAGISVEELDAIIPHQANQRIIDAIEFRLKIPKERMYSNICELGNTSSNTIPLCLETLLPTGQKGQRWGLTAFGGGFTYGASILEVL